MWTHNQRGIDVLDRIRCHIHSIARSKFGVRPQTCQYSRMYFLNQRNNLHCVTSCNGNHRSCAVEFQTIIGNRRFIRFCNFCFDYRSEPLAIYRLSYLWYTTFGFLIVIIVGMIVSGLTGWQDPKKLNPNLVYNIGQNLFWYLPKGAQEYLRCNVGDDYVSFRYYQRIISLNRNQL